MRITTPGRLMLEKHIPESYRDGIGLLDKKGLEKLATDIAKSSPEDYSAFIGGVSDVAREVVYRHGREASVGLSDLKLSETMSKYRDNLRQKVKNILVDPRTASDEKNQQVIDLMLSEIKKLPKKIAEDMKGSRNGLVEQMISGARGNPSQLMQVLFGDLLVIDAQDRPVPIAGLHSYGEGVTPLEYWAASSGARKGSVSVQFATAQGGYLGKQLSNLGHRIIVTEKDCGTKRGIPVDGSDPDNIGSVLALSVGGYSEGDIITPEMLDDLGEDKIYVRSVASCDAKEGVCSKCAGVRESNKLPDIGSHVGVIGPRAVSEPITQSGLSIKHSGGVAGADDKQVSGFKEMDQFLQVPQKFMGAATLSKVDGVVTAVKKAPAGGHFVFVNSEEHYVPRDIDVTVSPGTKVTAGDVLTDGIPNPSELVTYKGIGEGRRYFIDQYREILKRNGADVHRRNIEVLAKGFIDRVKIDNPEGYGSYFYEDVVPYDHFIKDYVPRKDSIETGLPFARNKYLEKPYLHYTIGTRVTPEVEKNLRKYNVKSVLVNQEKPPFKGEVIRTRSLLATDPDWMTRLAGEGLKKSLLESARMGATSTAGGTSYYPAVADPSKLDMYKGGRSEEIQSRDYIEI